MEYNGPLLFGAPQVTGDFHWFSYFFDWKLTATNEIEKKYANVVLFDQKILFVMPESSQVCEARGGH